jgi:hypothetical protein
MSRSAICALTAVHDEINCGNHGDAVTELSQWISCFYMMTRTALSAATRAQRRRPSLANELDSRRTPRSAATGAQKTNPVLCSSSQPPTSSFQNLIANLELEFELNCRKENLLRISNRKYFAIFASTVTDGDSHDERETIHPPLEAARIFPMPLALLHLRKLKLSRDAVAGSRNTESLIYCAAIRNPRKALET